MVLDPGRWDTVAGHVDVTPDYEESARIELREEGGIEDVPLDETAYFYADSPYHNDIHPKRFIKIFRVRHDGKTAKPSDDEVAATRWFTKEELRTLGTEHPEQLAVGLEICMPYILDERPKGNSPLMASAAS
jgi:isopentenyldiphosphate isomerase